MHFHPVRALEEGVWNICRRRNQRMAAHAAAEPDLYMPLRYLVRVLVEEAKWAIDGVGVDVEQGLVVSFSREDDAKYFLSAHGRREAPKCEPVWVAAGMIVAFHDPNDAQFFVETGKAEPISEEEFVAIVQAQRQLAEPEVVTAEKTRVGSDAEVTQTKPKSKKGK